MSGPLWIPDPKNFTPSSPPSSPLPVSNYLLLNVGHGPHKNLSRAKVWKPLFKGEERPQQVHFLSDGKWKLSCSPLWCIPYCLYVKNPVCTGRKCVDWQNSQEFVLWHWHTSTLNNLNQPIYQPILLTYCCVDRTLFSDITYQWYFKLTYQ